MFFLSVQAWVLISLCVEMYYNCIDSYLKIDALLISTCTFLALLKITWFRIYVDNLNSNFRSAIIDYFTIDNEEKRAVMRRHAFMGRICCYGVACVSYVASGFYMSLPLVIGDSGLQINGTVVSPNTKYPVPSTCTLGSLPISTTWHIVIFLMQATVLVIVCTGNLGNESVSFLAH